MDKLLEHFKYPSTWIAVVATVGGVFGWVITPELQTQIAQLAVALVAFISFFYSDTDVK